MKQACDTRFHHERVRCSAPAPGSIGVGLATSSLGVHRTFWIDPGRLAGRPGPNRFPWDLGQLRAAGIGAVLSVNDGASCRREEIEAAGLAYRCVPLPDHEPPEPGDDAICLRGLAEAQAFIEAQHALERAVLVHCTSGKDRTGLVLAYYLIRRDGLDVAAAIAAVRRVRPIALSAIGWHALGLSVLSQLAAPPIVTAGSASSRSIRPAVAGEH
jgi:protein-tyrosine phosphatase